MRKIPLEEWLSFYRGYFADLKGKSLFDPEVTKEVNRRLAELSMVEQALFRSGQLEEPSDDFDQSHARLVEANKKLGRMAKDAQPDEDTKRRVKNFCHGRGSYVSYSGMSEQQAVEAVEKLAKAKGWTIKGIEKIR